MRRSTQKIASDLFTRAKLLKRTSDRDGDGDGLINDGTPQERPVGYDPKANVTLGKSQWDHTAVKQIANHPGSEVQRQKQLAQQLTFEQWSDEKLNTPVGRMKRALAGVRLDENKDYELKFVPIDSVKLTQDGDDYNNSSSENTARNFAKIAERKLKINDVRPQDLNPVILDSNGFMRDGHHRHAAHRMTGSKTILALVPKPGNGTRKITNLRGFYDQMTQQ